MNKTSQFIKNAKQLYGDRYDYSEFIYTTSQTSGIIKCSIHGSFNKSPNHHVQRQQGCPDCTKVERSRLKSYTVEMFIAKARQVHGELYDYSGFVYKGSTVKGKIRCTMHDIIFDQIPSHHLSGHSGCDECTKTKSKKTQLVKYGAEHHSQSPEFIEKVHKTSLERFGVEHYSKTSEFIEQGKQNSIQRFGVEYASQSPEFQERVRQTSIERFGVKHFLQDPEVRAKITETNMQRYGIGNVKQAHIPTDSIAILDNREALIELLKTHSVRELAMSLEISNSTLGRYCHDHDIILPSSSYEGSLVEFLRQHVTIIDMHNRNIIKPLEIDIVLPEHKIGIEFGGIYWHGEGKISDKGYHLNKLHQMRERGYRLITLFEDELLHKRDIVENRLLNLLRKSSRGKGARQLNIQKINSMQSNDFLDAYHIQGRVHNGYVRYGAFDRDELVAVMIFAHPRIALGRNNGADELLRFATNGKNYPGVASRLFATFVQEYKPDQIISYADRRWSEGNMYRQLGFKLVHETEPNYWYTDRNKIIREHRFKYRKSMIKHLVKDGDLKTEFEIMTELGRDRIWDCGSLKYIWTK